MTYLTKFNASRKSQFRYLILLILTIVVCDMEILKAQSHTMYVGTYTDKSDSKGVYVYNFDENTGKTNLMTTIALNNPSFLARQGNVLYAVNEDTNGMLTAYDLKNNKILSTTSTDGMHPCHVAISPRDPVAVVSNYSSGSLCLFRLDEDGSVRSKDDFLKFEGSSINKSRQGESHIHSAFFTKDGKQVFVSDLGADLIYVFEIRKGNQGYRFQKIQEIKTKAGGGPRHLAFSKDEKTFYSVLELTGEIEVFQKAKELWSSRQIVPMFPENFEGEHGGGDIKLDKSGNILYATNRGTANLLASFQIDLKGLLSLKSLESVEGDSPRNLNLSPEEKFILISNQNSNNITIIPKEGTEKIKLQIPKPVCVIF